MSNLAIYGGFPVRTRPFPNYNTISDEEKAAVLRVLDSGVLSKFIGAHHQDFIGGPNVLAFEEAWQLAFQVEHAISMNSATSCLYAAVGAAGVGPGDEVIVSPYTMSASATAALIYGAVPIFADIDPNTLCITAETIEKKITKKTRAIIVVDLFGYPADITAIRKIADKYSLFIIEDSAQAPMAYRKNNIAGTNADIGIYSLNYHKHIHTGEGGVAVTNNKELSNRLKLIRNHAESVVEDMEYTNIGNMIGFNYRMTEIEAAIGIEQLKKLPQLVQVRQIIGEHISKALEDNPVFTTTKFDNNIKHAYYVFPIFLTDDYINYRKIIAKALSAEGLKVSEGYVKPLYLLPLYQKQIAYAKDNYPFKYSGHDYSQEYKKGSCTVAENMHYKKLLLISDIHAMITEDDIEDILKIIRKISDNIHELIN